MFNCAQFTELVLRRALYDLQLLCDDSVELLLFTCANESFGGTYLHEVKGSGIGIYQMKPGIYNDIWQNFILFKSSILIQLVHNFDAPTMPSEDRLIYDLHFASAMARLHYARVKEPLPNAKQPQAIWEYYKNYYNKSADNWHQAISNYHKFKLNHHQSFASGNCS